MMAVKMIILIFIWFLSVVLGDRCSYQDRCICANTTLSCFEEDIFTFPQFTSHERRFVLYMDLRKTKMVTLPNMSRHDWPYLKVKFGIDFIVHCSACSVY